MSIWMTAAWGETHTAGVFDWERRTMKRVWLVLLTWALAGIGAVVGSIVGSRGGQRQLLAGAILGGALATISAAWLALRFLLIAPQQVRRTSVVCLFGFAVATTLGALYLY